MGKEYDIIIVGGGTSGCACAWTAAKKGLKTLLIEKRSYLGGAITAQLVIPAMKTTQNELNVDFFKELVNIAHQNNAQITYSDGNTGWFNPLKMPEILHDMLISEGCDIIYNTEAQPYIDTKHINNASINNLKIKYIVPKHNDNIVSPNFDLSLYTDTKHSDNVSTSKAHKICAKYFVDASGDAWFSELCGANFLPKEGFQALSLRFIMAGIDKKTFADWLLKLDRDRNVTTASTIDSDIHLSTACTWDLAPNWALKPLFDNAVEQNILKDTDRAYFQVFSIPGEDDKIAFNCPRIPSDESFDVIDKHNQEISLNTGKDIIKRLENFCRSYFKGFESSYVYKIADELGIRESRRVLGKYILTKEDIYNAKEFETPVAYSNYPIDIHSIKRDNSTLHYVQKTYSIPLESLIVNGFDNLFVIGRCLSADFYAQAAVRIQPTCFSMGEGVAKYVYRLLQNITK